MSELPTWFQEVQKEVHIDNDAVLIDRFDHLFHTPKQMQTEWDMSEEKIFEAVTYSRPCSKCFPNLHTFLKTQEQMELNKIK
mgnify:CR=1 FL=1